MQRLTPKRSNIYGALFSWSIHRFLFRNVRSRSSALDQHQLDCRYLKDHVSHALPYCAALPVISLMVLSYSVFICWTNWIYWSSRYEIRAAAQNPTIFILNVITLLPVTTLINYTFLDLYLTRFKRSRKTAVLRKYSSSEWFYLLKWAICVNRKINLTQTEKRRAWDPRTKKKLNYSLINLLFILGPELFFFFFFDYVIIRRCEV